MRSTLLAGAAAALAMAATSGAHAATYLLTVDGCTGGCFASGATSVGKVTTAQDGTDTIKVTVTLDSGYTFHDGGGSPHDVLAFNLPGISSVSISNLASPLTANGTQNAGSHFETGLFGDFGYALDFPKTQHPATISAFSFDITAAQLKLSSFGSNSKGYAFTTDINGNGHTGNVGAVGVPEPATWAMMLTGFGAIGAAMRSKRRQAAAA